MANVYKWSNVAVLMQSALGTDNTITGISKASTGVVTYSGSDPTNGDFILLTVQGMYQVDARVFRVANVNAGSNTLELEGENTTTYETFTSGKLNVITYGTSLTSATNLSTGGGNFNFIDVTTIHDNTRKQIPGLPDAINYEFTNIWDPADAALAAMKVASDNQQQRCFQFRFGSSGPKILFVGYVGATLLPSGQAQDKVETSVAITMFGRPTLYST